VDEFGIGDNCDPLTISRIHRTWRLQDDGWNPSTYLTLWTKTVTVITGSRDTESNRWPGGL